MSAATVGLPLDEFVESLAAEKGYDFVQIHDLGNDEQMKAVGKFGHAFVAAHPGDKGMAVIAERIYNVLFSGLLA